MSSIKPVSFKSQQQAFNPNEFYIVRKPSQEDIKAMRRKRTARTIGSSAVWAGVWTAAEALIYKTKSAKAIMANFGITFGIFAVASVLINALFNRRS